MSHFHESCNICTLHVIDIAIRLSTIFNALSVDVTHNFVKSAVYFFSSPA